MSSAEEDRNGADAPQEQSPSPAQEEGGYRESYLNDDERLELQVLDKAEISFVMYETHSADFLYWRWARFLEIPARHRALAGDSLLRRLDDARESLRVNQRFLDAAVAASCLRMSRGGDALRRWTFAPHHDSSEDEDGDVGEGAGAAGTRGPRHLLRSTRVLDACAGSKPLERDFDKARGTLRLVARDWSEECADERAATYGVMLSALEALYPDRAARAAVKVLTPGCGTARLTYDVVARGFSSVGNEFSFHMLLASHLILNCCSRSGEFEVRPWCTEACNLRSGDDQNRAYHVPDAVPSQLEAADLPDGGEPPMFGMAQGDFTELFAGADERGEFNAVLTCFFIDCARNVYEYIEVISNVIAPGGHWINLGPLLYHFAGHEGSFSSASRGGSIEPTWEELEAAIQKLGFRFLEGPRVIQDVPYTANRDMLMRTSYNCVYFVAQRVPTDHAPDDEGGVGVVA